MQGRFRRCQIWSALLKRKLEDISSKEKYYLEVHFLHYLLPEKVGNPLYYKRPNLVDSNVEDNVSVCGKVGMILAVYAITKDGIICYFQFVKTGEFKKFRILFNTKRLEINNFK